MVAVLDNGRQDFYVGIYPPTGDYEFLDNQPAIDGIVLTKSTTKADLDLDKVFQYRGQVASYSKLPKKDRVTGDTYNVQDTGENYAWNGSSWDLLTGTEAVYWRNGALESQGSTLTIDSDKNPISNLVLADITDITATATEVNVLDGITASTSELNIMDGVTASTSEINILDGVTANKDEINILDGATLTTTELNYVDGVTSSIQTQLNGKQPNITGAATTITSSDLTKNRAIISNGSGKIAVSSVTDTELGYVSGVTSAIQTQLNNKQPTITGAATTIASNDLTINRALISNNSGKVAVSSVTDTELGYVSGVTSAIQTQINGKQATIDSSHMLSSDLVDDTNKTHLFVSSTEKETWSGKQDAISNLQDIIDGASAGSTATQPSDVTDLIEDSVLSDTSAPTTSTEGYLGQIFVDKDTQTGYMCVAVDTETPDYTWKQITV